MTTSEAARLSPEDIDVLLNSKIATARRRIAAEPETYLVVTPGQHRMALQTRVISNIAPDVTGQRHIEYKLQHDQGGIQWHELSIDAGDNPFGAYQVLALITEIMRTGTKFHDAVPVAIGNLRELLARRTRLSEEQQTGLMGELLLLEHCLSVAPEESLEAWLGMDREEHDFVFSDFDIEVKATRSEARVHMINSLTQLAAAPQRPLYLVSIQLTGGGSASEGRSLAELITDIRVATNERWHQGIDAKLGRAGWHDDDADLYPTRWIYRSRPRAYLVDEFFPALTPETVSDNVPSPQLIVSVRYQVDVSLLQHSRLVQPIEGFVEAAL